MMHGQKKIKLKYQFGIYNAMSITTRIL